MDAAASIQAENTRMVQSAQRVSMMNKIKGHDEQTMELILKNLKVPPSPNLGRNVDVSV